MPIKQIPLRPIQLTYRCDCEDCDGEVKVLSNLSVADRWGLDNQLIPHTCVVCNTTYNFKEPYPLLRYCYEGALISPEELGQFQPVVEDVKDGC